MPSIHRYKHDWLVSLGIIFVIISIYGSMLYFRVTRLREEALIFELRSLRQAVIIHIYMNAEKPDDLETLIKARFKTADDVERSYIPQSILKRNGSDKLIDPFGNNYIYNYKTGWINTTTNDYKMW